MAVVYEELLEESNLKGFDSVHQHRIVLKVYSVKLQTPCIHAQKKKEKKEGI